MRPEPLVEQYRALRPGGWILIDEVQKIPKLLELESDIEKARYLRSYCLTYLKEEVVAEQLVRNLDLFRFFLPIAAQMETQIVHYSNIARDIGSDGKVILVEIKSSAKIDSRHIKSLIGFKKDFPGADLFCASRVEFPQSIDGIEVLPWSQALERICS